MVNVRFLCVIVLASVFSSCGSSMERVTLQVGKDQYSIEVAKSPKDRQKGLMNRRTLAAHSGMLFVFKKDRRLSFWMKNTFVPLSIAYLSSDGTVKEIHSMVPRSLNPVISRHFVRYALELPEGAFARSGVRIGDKIIIPEDVCTAVQ